MADQAFLSLDRSGGTSVICGYAKLRMRGSNSTIALCAREREDGNNEQRRLCAYLPHDDLEPAAVVLVAVDD